MRSGTAESGVRTRAPSVRVKAARMGHGSERASDRYSRRNPHSSGRLTVYLLVVPIFLLFIAVLAYAWFYLQHAKARDAAKAIDPGSAAPATDQ